MIFSHSSGGQKSEIRVSAEPVSVKDLGSRGESFLASSQLPLALSNHRCSLSCNWIVPISALVFARPSSLLSPVSVSSPFLFNNLEPIIQSEEKSEREISYTNTYIWNLERWYWCSFLQGNNGDTDREQTYGHGVGVGRRGWDVRRE